MTRLNYREAFMLLDAACRGHAEIEVGDDPYYRPSHEKALDRAIGKLKDAICISGGYDEQGNLFDPFPAQRPRRRKDGLSQKTFLEGECE